MRGKLWRWWRGQQDKWFPEDAIVSRGWNGTIGLAWLAFCGPLLWEVARVLFRDGSGPDSGTGLILVALSVVGVFASGRRLLVACFLDITRAEAKKHDLWHGERLFLAGVMLLVAASLVTVCVLHVDDAQVRELFTVVLGLLVIAPVAVWAGGDRWILWRLTKPKIDAKFDYAGGGEQGSPAEEVADPEPTPEPGPTEESWTPEGEGVRPGSLWAETALAGAILIALGIQEGRRRRWF